MNSKRLLKYPDIERENKMASSNLESDSENNNPENKRMESELERLREALSWYADLKVSQVDEYGETISVDYGRMARNALKRR